MIDRAEHTEMDVRKQLRQCRLREMIRLGLLMLCNDPDPDPDPMSHLNLDCAL